MNEGFVFESLDAFFQMYPDVFRRL